MWLLVMFDLPVGNPDERKAAANFRKALLQDGFNMMQFSVYARDCPTKENLQVHKDRVLSFLPPSGSVSMMQVTDKQFSSMITVVGQKRKKPQDRQQMLKFY